MRQAPRSCSRMGAIAWPEGRPASMRLRTPLRWKRRQIGELVADRDAPFLLTTSARCSSRSPTIARLRSSHGRAVMRGVLAQEIHHRVKEQPADGCVAPAACKRARTTLTRARHSSTP